MTGKEIFWLVMVFATLVPFMFLLSVVNERAKSFKMAVALSAAVIVVMGFTIAALPIKRLRVATDIEHLSHAPFKVTYLKLPKPGSRIVDLTVINAKGETMHLDINRDTRRVRFSGVRVPDSIQF